MSKYVDTLGGKYKDSETKNLLLDAYLKEPISALDYYNKLFMAPLEAARKICDLEYIGIPYVLSNQAVRLHTADSADDLLQAACCRSDCYAPLGLFFRNWPCKSLLKTQLAFVVDIEYLNSQTLENFLRWALPQKDLKPTYIVNSGNGIHLVYQLAYPLEAYRPARRTIESVHTALVGYYSSGKLCVDQGTTHVQSYRVVGSLSKAGNTVYAWKTGAKPMSIEYLCDYFRIEYSSSPPHASDSRKQSTVKSRAGRRAYRKDHNIKLKPNAQRGFYVSALAQYIHPPIGQRYYSLMALAIIAYKSHIPRDRLEADIRAIVIELNARTPNNTVTECDINAALACYSSKHVDTTRERINQLGGYNYQPVKRNGKSRKQHLIEARQTYAAQSRDECIKAIRSAVSSSATQPVSIAYIMKQTGLSRNTIKKYLCQL